MSKERVLLIDDCRNEEDPSIMRRLDVIARNYDEGRNQLMNNGPWDLLLLDHDLNSFSEDGTKEFTGYDLICELENELRVRNYDVIPKKIICVSSNPPGRARIETVIKKLYEDN